ncbi:MAG: hypothetical protein HWN67_11395 [Candidatus Helarchaeota archaeon]|nr:hypothetical protein [Candidatus Helarchaeota archaeon]
MGEIQNIASFVLGLLVLIVATVSLFLPESNIPLFLSLHYLGVLLSVVSGILLLLSGTENSRALSGTGFGLGMGGWCLVIAFNIYGLVWNLYQVSYHEGILWSMFPYSFDREHLISMVIFYMNLIQPFQRGTNFAITHIVLGGSSLVFGSVSFGVLIEKTRF